MDKPLFNDEYEQQQTSENSSDVKQKEPVEEVIDNDEEFDTVEGNVLELPSKGAMGYPSHVEYRDIMAGDEETLASATGSTYSKTLNGVLKSVLNNCKFFEELTVHDRDYCLIWLWSNNYSNMKTLNVECGSCGNVDKHEINMLKLPVTDLHDKFKNPFVIPVKKTGGEIKVRLSTVSDEIWCEEYIIRQKQKVKSGKKTTEYTFDQLMLWRSIDIGVDLPFEQKVSWIKANVSGREMGYVRHFHSFFRYGIDTALEFNCSSCGEVTKGQLPFQIEDILYPTVQSGFEELL